MQFRLSACKECGSELINVSQDIFEANGHKEYLFFCECSECGEEGPHVENLTHAIFDWNERNKVH